MVSRVIDLKYNPNQLEYYYYFDNTPVINKDSKESSESLET